MAQKQIIPVFLGEAPSGAPNGYVGRPPIIFVHLASDRKWTPAGGGYPAYSAIQFRAMLDTGADGSAVDDGVATQLGAERLERATVHGLSGAGQEEAEGTRIQVVMPTTNAVFAERMVIRDFRGQARPWDVVLGRSFLRFCVLTADGPNAKYCLDWVGPLPANI